MYLLSIKVINVLQKLAIEVSPYFLRSNGAIQFAFSPKGQGERYIFSHSGAVSLNEWTHIAGVIDTENNIMQLYIDGLEVGSNGFNWNPEIYESKVTTSDRTCP